MARIAAVLLTLLCLTACADPYDRPGTWQASGLNDANITAMLNTPTDSVAGRGELGARGAPAADAVTRLLSGNRAMLRDPRSGAAASDGSTSTGSGVSAAPIGP